MQKVLLHYSLLHQLLFFLAHHDVKWQKLSLYPQRLSLVIGKVVYFIYY